MATLYEAILATQDTAFTDKIAAASVKVGQDVLAEQSGGYSVAWQRKRAAFAALVLHAPNTYKSHFVYGLAVAGLSSLSTDDEIEAAVLAQWDAYAGVSGEDRTT